MALVNEQEPVYAWCVTATLRTDEPSSRIWLKGLTAAGFDVRIQKVQITEQEVTDGD